MLDKQVARARHPHFGTLIKEIMGVAAHNTGGGKLVMQQPSVMDAPSLTQRGPTAQRGESKDGCASTTCQK